MGTYTVRMECKIIKLVTCENCTEEEARNDPFSFATDEQELDQVDWDVLSVREEEE